METKKCTKCGRELPVSEFYKCAKNKNGLYSYCKDCANLSTHQSRAKRKTVANTLRMRGQIGGGEERTPNQIIEEIRENVNILRGIGFEINVEINYTKTIKI